MSIAYKHLSGRVPKPSSASPHVPTELDGFVLSATDRDRELRPESAVEMRRDLESIASGLPAARSLAAVVSDLPEVDGEGSVTERVPLVASTTRTIPRAERTKRRALPPVQRHPALGARPGRLGLGRLDVPGPAPRGRAGPHRDARRRGEGRPDRSGIQREDRGRDLSTRYPGRRRRQDGSARGNVAREGRDRHARAVARAEAGEGARTRGQDDRGSRPHPGARAPHARNGETGVQRPTRRPHPADHVRRGRRESAPRQRGRRSRQQGTPTCPFRTWSALPWRMRSRLSRTWASSWTTRRRSSPTTSSADTSSARRPPKANAFSPERRCPSWCRWDRGSSRRPSSARSRDRPPKTARPSTVCM